MAGGEVAGGDWTDFAVSVRAEAAGWDRRGAVPAEVVRVMGKAGFLATGGRTAAELGDLCACLGGVCSALRALVTVQGMVTAAVSRWGSADQRARWLPEWAAGEQVAAFAATEPGAGSALSAVATTVTSGPEGLRVSGYKQWVTFGQVADVFLVLGSLAGRAVAVLVEADRLGVTVEPVTGQLGLRAAQLAHVRFADVPVPAENVVAPAGFGLSHVVGTALDHGRFTVAWGCVGMAEACLHHTATHVRDRVQGGVRLADQQAVRALLGRCLVETSAARQLCVRAADLRDRGEPDAIAGTVLAKYAAAKAASVVSEHAVRLHGASGCAQDSTVGRFYRDAAVMRIIEGADEVAEQHLGDHVLRWRA